MRLNLTLILGIVLFKTICDASVTKYEIKEYDSVAYENATVIRGNARFTVLTVRFASTFFSQRSQTLLKTVKNDTYGVRQVESI